MNNDDRTNLIRRVSELEGLTEVKGRALISDRGDAPNHILIEGDYILKSTITAYRREGLENVSLPACYSERPNAERNYLGPDFRRTLYEVAGDFWKLERSTGLFSMEELAAMIGEEDNFNPLPESDDAVINENRRRVKDTIRLGVKNVNVEIPKDVHFQNEEQTLQVEQVKFARKASEIDRVFLAYISTKGHQFESKGRTDKIAGYLLEMLADYFGIFETDAKKVVLYHDNKPKFDRLIDKALETYARKRQTDKARSAARREFKQYDWEVPEERVYDSETNHIEEAPNHALQPFVQLNQASCPEKEFVKFLEANHEWIDWWYKNGDKGKQHYAIAYGEGKARSLFYVDFIIRMKNGHVYLFDTKSAGSDALAHEKHNALLKYIQKNSTEGTPLFGGIILQQGSNWLYSKLPIENTTDTLNWDCFYPETA